MGTLIAGEVFDEHDQDVASPITREPQGSYLVLGSATLRDINRELDVSLSVTLIRNIFPQGVNVTVPSSNSVLVDNANIP